MTSSSPPPARVGMDDDTQAVAAVDVSAEPAAPSDSAAPAAPVAPAAPAEVSQPTVTRGRRAAPRVVPPRAADVAPTPGTVDTAPPVAVPVPDAGARPITSAVRRTGKVRKARLRLLRVEPWSVMKSAFVLSIAVGITFVVATATLWSVIDAAGVFDVVGGLLTEFTQSPSSAGVNVNDYVGFSRVVGLATVISVVNVVLLTALATLFAFLYNLSAALLGGFEVTLAEDD